MQATSNKLEFAKNNQNSNKNKAKPAAAYSKKVEAEIKKGLNDVIPSGTTVAGYNSSTGTFAYGKDILITEAQNQIDGWIKLIENGPNHNWLQLLQHKKKQKRTILKIIKHGKMKWQLMMKV